MRGLGLSRMERELPEALEAAEAVVGLSVKIQRLLKPTGKP